MDNQDFIEQAKKIFGPQWQGGLAKALNINDRTIRRWVSGEMPPPSWLFDWLSLAGNPPPSSEWVLGNGEDGSRYLIRTRIPRFFGIVLKRDKPDWNDDPVAGLEIGPGNKIRDIVSLDGQSMLSSLSWIDLPPANRLDLEKIYKLAAEAYKRLNK